MSLQRMFMALMSGGGGSPNAQCTGVTAFDSGVSQSEAGFRVTNPGAIERVLASGNTFIANYVDSTPPDVGDDFEIMVTQSAGDALTGINSGLNVWLQINVTRTWSFDDSPGEFKTFTGNFQVREIADTGNISASCSLQFDTEDGS